MAVMIKKGAAKGGVVVKEAQQEPMLYKFGSCTTPLDLPMNARTELLGGKGENLMEMASLGVPVPSGVTIPCWVSIKYLAASDWGKLEKLPELKSKLRVVVKDAVAYLTEVGEGVMPLVSVRSGARVSMPGMMDTILNVGITQANLPEWEARMGEWTARDSYRRLLQMYGSVTLGIPMSEFVKELGGIKEATHTESDSDLSSDALSRLVTNYLLVFEKHGKTMPDTVEDQIYGAMVAVFKSWDNPRAKEYRKIEGFSDDWGTAVTIQEMVFGNADDNSCTGVLFTRNPSNGSKGMTGEFLVNAQGEDVVAGIRTPEPIAELGPTMGMSLGGELFDTAAKLEAHYRDMQDIEFTVQSGKLYVLQTRNGKRAPLAAFKIAHDMLGEGIISMPEALSRVSQKQLLSLTQPSIDPAFTTPPDMVGIAAGGGLVTGVAVFTSEEAVSSTAPCILVREETDPNDIAGMAKATGILTTTGGLTSHAAVVARGLNKTCVVGTTSLQVHHQIGVGWIGGIKMDGVPNKTFMPGDRITMDGATGRVWVGVEVPVVGATMTDEVRSLLKMAMTKQEAIERLPLPSEVAASTLTTMFESAFSDEVFIDVGAMLLDANADSVLPLLGAALLVHDGFRVVACIDDAASRWSEGDSYAMLMTGLEWDIKTRQTQVAEYIVAFDKSVLERLIVVSTSHHAIDARTILADAGVVVAGHVRCFNDLLQMKALLPHQHGDATLAAFGSKAAYDTAVAMVEFHQGEFKKVKKANYWFDVFKKGGG